MYSHGQKTLHHASMNDRLEIVKFLVDAGACIDVEDELMVTPLFSQASLRSGAARLTVITRIQRSTYIKNPYFPPVPPAPAPPLSVFRILRVSISLPPNC